MANNHFRDADWVWAKLMAAYEAETGLKVGAIDAVYEKPANQKHQEIAFMGRLLSDFKGVQFDIDAT